MEGPLNKKFDQLKLSSLEPSWEFLKWISRNPAVLNLLSSGLKLSRWLVQLHCKFFTKISGSEVEFKVFEPRLKYETRLKHIFAILSTNRFSGTSIFKNWFMLVKSYQHWFNTGNSVLPALLLIKILL